MWLRTGEGGSFTGAEIETAVARYIAVLERHGVALGATVGLLAGNSVEVLFAQQAIGVIGGVFTPFHPLGAPADFAYIRSEEHTSELQSLMRISYAVFCLKKKTNTLY